jgi:hypothetical protein
VVRRPLLIFLRQRHATVFKLRILSRLKGYDVAYGLSTRSYASHEQHELSQPQQAD